MKKNNSLTIILVVLLLLVAAAIIFMLTRQSILFSPEAPSYKITDFVANVKATPSQYTIVIPNDASASMISVVSDFASAFGEFQQTKIYGEIDQTSTKLVYFKTDSSLAQDSKVVYYASKQSLLITAKNDAALLDIKNKLVGVANGNYQTEFATTGASFTNNVAGVLACSDGTPYESCSSTKPKYCTVTNLDSLASLIDRTDLCGLPEPPAPTPQILTVTRTTDKQSVNEGESFKVTLTITGDSSKIKDQVLASLADQIIGGEITAPAPKTGANINTAKTEILWLSAIDLTERTSASYTITAKTGAAEVKFGSDASAVYAKASDGKAETISIIGTNSVQVTSIQPPQPPITPPTSGGGDSTQPRQCTENWQCNAWGDCISSQRTRICTDSNNCGTTISKPTTTEPCCVESWTCTDWSVCANNQRTRTCTDANACSTTALKPIISETCTSCTDTDKGIDIFTSGIVSVAGVTYADTCDPAAKKITEYSCTPEGTMQSIIYDCALCSGNITNRPNCTQQFAGCTPTCSAGQECIIPEGSATGTCQTKVLETNLYAEISGIETNLNHGYKGVVGKLAATIDSIGMIDLAGKFKITQTKTDDQYAVITSVQDNIILVGGPCVNTLARELKNSNKIKYGCSDWPGGGNFAAAEFIPDAFGPGKNAIFVAGTRGEDTRAMTQILKKYKDTDKEAKFKVGKKVCTSLTPGFCQSIGLTDSTNTI